MNIIPIGKEQLDKFVASQPRSQILQSSVWAEFKKKLGSAVWTIGLADDDNNLIATALIIEHELPLNKSYLYCPRGPVIDPAAAYDHSLIIKLIFKEARDITIETKTAEEIFFRIEPTFAFNAQAVMARPTKPIQPKLTLMLDLSLSEDLLISQQHQKTRYNINLAKKKGVIVKEGSLADFEEVWKIFSQTSQRDEFHLHPKNYYQTMLATADSFKLLLATFENKIIALAIISRFGDTVTYLHGASDYQYRQLMAASLLQWEIIRSAKAQGYRYYDFHGIAPQGEPKHSWAGISRFKRGFGGQEVSFAGAYDFIYQPGWYRMYEISRKLNSFLKKPHN